MEIPPITITFQTADAQHALELLAEAALDSPDIVKGIAKLEAPLFNSAARESDFRRGPDEGRSIEVAIFPTEKLKQFLRGLGKWPSGHREDVPAIQRTR